MDPDKIPFYLRKLGEQVENRVANALGGRDEDSDDGKKRPTGMPPMRNEYMEYVEPDWEDLDRKANLIVARYTVVSTASNILPFGLDMVAVTASFTKMTTELAGVYQVIVSAKRARQMGWAIATTTGTVLGAAYAGSRIAKFIPGGYLVGVAVQAPLVGAVAWAAGDTLKDYFKQTRMGREPGIEGLRDSFAKTLRIRLKKVKIDAPVAADATAADAATPAATKPAAETSSVSDAVEKIAGLHELLRQGAITQDEFDKKKADLLKQL